jgi:hypothetical protein
MVGPSIIGSAFPSVHRRRAVPRTRRPNSRGPGWNGPPVPRAPDPRHAARYARRRGRDGGDPPAMAAHRLARRNVRLAELHSLPSGEQRCRGHSRRTSASQCAPLRTGGEPDQSWFRAAALAVPTPRRSPRAAATQSLSSVRSGWRMSGSSALPVMMRLPMLALATLKMTT